jgi:L-arabinokinase
MKANALPVEVAEFGRLLQRPHSDETGLAGFFSTAEILLVRVPARLDVMGGIADYSGANVCEGTLGRGIVIALQPRTDRTLRIRTVQMARRSLPVETRIPLDYFMSGDRMASYEQVREVCRSNPLISWAAYVGGSIFTLLKEESAPLGYGFNLLLLSGVPMNVGIGSSAAVEIAAIHCLQSWLGLKLSASRLAQLGQLAENQVVGAPCGIMDQIAVASGREGRLLHILCRPGQVEGEVRVPEGTALVGVNSMVKHSVAGPQYGDVRIGAFMGRRIINDLRAAKGQAPLSHLCEISVADFEGTWRKALPERMLGSEFLARWRSHDDPATTIQPDAMYRVAGPTAHPVHENERVLRFMACLGRAGAGDRSALVEAGAQMYGAHESYRDNCHLSCEEVDWLVEEVRRRGPGQGLYGAKITGGGSGGTVAVFGQAAALERELPKIAEDYKRRVGVAPDLFGGTSPGALEFGSMRWRFGPGGWRPAGQAE